jgi:uncharacterized membrane protein YozB (DUF420 family)
MKGTRVLTGPNVILALKVAVAAVTVLLLASLVCLARGNVRLHGRINIVFFALTVTTLVAFELVIRVIQPTLFNYIDTTPDVRANLNIHLWFAVPSALLMPFMLWTGLTHRRSIHLVLATIFGIFWTATFITGVFFLPHTAVEAAP